MSDPSANVNQLVDHLFRQEAGRMVAILTRLFGIHNLELAEDILQDTLQQALKDWSLGGIPGTPPGWLMVVARRKAINAIKREKFYGSFAPDMDALLKSEWTAAYAIDNIFLEDEIKDSQLRMMFTCCHPALPPEAQIALTLKTLCGFSIPEIGTALLTSEANISKRLYRAKEKIRSEQIGFSVPSGKELIERLDSVLLVIYLLFNEGYNSASDRLTIRKDLCLEAMRLARLLMDTDLIRGYSSVYALLALMCFHAARFDARMDSNNELIVLEDQDRNRWDKDLIQQGVGFLLQSASGNTATHYHLEAAIASEHCLAPDFQQTNWNRIHGYYSALEKLKPSPVIKLNLAIIAGKRESPEAAICLLQELKQYKALEGSYLLYASLGEYYFQSGKNEEAQNHFQYAKTLVRSPAILELLQRKINKCDSGCENKLSGAE